jgi:hypothetical protein
VSFCVERSILKKTERSDPTLRHLSASGGFDILRICGFRFWVEKRQVCRKDIGLKFERISRHYALAGGDKPRPYKRSGGQTYIIIEKVEYTPPFKRSSN